MINTILETRPKEVQLGEGKSIEEKVTEILKGMMPFVPASFDPKLVREEIQKKKGPSRLTVSVEKNEMTTNEVARGLQVPLNVFLL